MPTPEKHALLSASAAERWLHCPPSARLTAEMPDKTSEYAEEGRLAHSLAELKVSKKFTQMKPSEYKKRLAALQKDARYQKEMESFTDRYLDFITEEAMQYGASPHVAIEVRLDFSDVVPDGFGTGDCILIGGNCLSIVDLKYGKGVPVSAQDNPQMRLYAAGALKQYLPIYGDLIQRVRMTIVQPRLDSISTEEITVPQLNDWLDSTVRPAAALAFIGAGEFQSGSWCRFCKAKATCRSRSDTYTTHADWTQAVPGLLSNSEIGNRLQIARELKAWASDLEEFALSQCLAGYEVPGWKAVEGRSTRKFNDQDAAFALLQTRGIDEALLYTREPITLTETEKLVGKKDFAELLEPYIIQAPGKPTLVPESGKRQAYSSAAVDFAGIV